MILAVDCENVKNCVRFMVVDRKEVKEKVKEIMFNGGKKEEEKNGKLYEICSGMLSWGVDCFEICVDEKEDLELFLRFFDGEGGCEMYESEGKLRKYFENKKEGDGEDWEEKDYEEFKKKSCMRIFVKGVEFNKMYVENFEF